MKKLNKYLSLILAICLLGSCDAYSKKIIRGNTVTKERSVPSFNGIDVESGFDVTIRQGDKEKLLITADENLFDKISTEVENGILKIRLERNINFSGGLKAEITVKEIKSIMVSGGGDVKTETKLTTDFLDMNMSGGGDLQAEIDANKLNSNISGGGDAILSGNIQFIVAKLSGGGDLKARCSFNKISCNISGGGDCDIIPKDKVDYAEIKISGGGDLTLNIDADKIKSDISGGGNANLSGRSSDLFIQVNGGGDVKGANFKAERAKIEASGGSNVEIYAIKELDVQASGGGNIYYAGDPEITRFNTSGGSEVHKR